MNKQISKHTLRIRTSRSGAPQKGISLAALKAAIAEDRVQVLLQPQVELATGTIRGVESLARLVGRDGELIAPGDFIPLAERSGLILPLGRRLFELSCAAALDLAAAGHGDLVVAINLSMRQLGDPHEVGILLAILERSGVRPQQIEIELTESAAIENFAIVHRQLQRFRSLGISVALDDFGTGFSSLTYLLELDVDRIKIDRSFIAALGRGDRSSLTDTMIDLGKKLSLDVVAEGVESEAEASWLRRHHCPTAQGFLFSRPITLLALLGKLAAAQLPAWEQLGTAFAGQTWAAGAAVA